MPEPLPPTAGPPSATGAAIPDHLRSFLAAPNYATLATAAHDGEPRTVVIWYVLDDDDRIVVNSLDGRRWPADLRRDPRCSLAVIDGADGERWVGIRGRVEEVSDDQATAQADIARLARRYDDPAEAERIIRERFMTQRRVSFRIRVLSVSDHLDD